MPRRTARPVISATFDSSVLVRALNFGGQAALLLARVKAGELRLDISEEIITETIGVLRDKFKQDPHTLNDNYPGSKRSAMW
jgi:hypothetical protein